MTISQDKLSQKSTEIIVSGVGCICALGNTLPGCMESLFNGVQKCGSPRNISIDRPEHYPVFEVDESVLPSKFNTDQLGRTAQLAIVSAYQAVEDAGYSLQDLRNLRVGVCVGTTVGSSLNNEKFYRQFRQGQEPDMTEMERFFRSNPAEAVAKEFCATGPVQTVVNACSSGADAIGLGMAWLKMGFCDLVIAGGSDELSRISYLGFISLMISDTQGCKPFDAERKGLNLGEGAAMLVLTKKQVRSTAYCNLERYASSCDAYHVTAPHPEGRGLRRALQSILQHNDISSEEIAFINAHGTGTPDNDKVEMKVLAKLFPTTPFFSVKGGTGHTLGAAGAIEAAITAACLQRQEIPASIGFSSCGEKDAFSPNTERKNICGRFAISQSLAFGGNNSVLLFSKSGQKRD